MNRIEKRNLKTVKSSLMAEENQRCGACSVHQYILLKVKLLTATYHCGFKK